MHSRQVIKLCVPSRKHCFFLLQKGQLVGYANEAQCAEWHVHTHTQSEPHQNWEQQGRVKSYTLL